MTDHAKMKDLLAARALGCLDEADREALELHLAACAECRGELAGLEASTALLLDDVEPVDPRPGAREVLLDRLPEKIDGRREERDARRSSRLPAWIGGLAAAAVIGGLFVSRQALERDLEQARLAADRLEASVAHLEKERADERVAREAMEKQLAMATSELDRLETVSSFLASVDVFTVTLKGTEHAPGAHARIAFDEESGRAWLFVADLPGVPEDKAYQLWFIEGDTPKPGRVFRPASGGWASVPENIPTDSRDAPTFAVTIEPKGGVPAPTGQIVLVGSRG